MHDPFEDFSEVFHALCKSVNTPYAQSCWDKWVTRSYCDQTAPNPEHYCSATSFGIDYLVYSWPSKAKCNVDGRDLKRKALDSFIADENFNKITSAKLRGWMQLGSHDPGVEELIFALRRKIASILGPCDYGKIFESCKFGNGATATISRRNARIDKKITTVPLSVSASALGLARCVVESDPLWLSAITGRSVEGPTSLLPENFQVVDYNVFDTVPKSLKTDRSIAKEPTLNGFLQQGVHIYLRKALKRCGVDLRDQTRNQRLAALAQSTGLATIDLKSASNSVTTALIELLFPIDWFCLLDSLRSRKTLLPNGELHKNVMFSSMGNAFTFELESLVFHAILHAVCGSQAVTSVYGDDIICPQKDAKNVITVLEAFGFRINLDKSFIEGRFFESCGKHFFDGFDVTPVYQKEPPRQSDIERIRAHNRLVRWALRSGWGLGLDSTVNGVCALIRRNTKDCLNGPIGSETDFWFQVPYGGYRVTSGFARFTALRPIVKRCRTRQSGSYAYWMRLRKDALLNPVRGEHSLVARIDTTCFMDSLVLSESCETVMYSARKERVSVHDIPVDVNWL